MNDNNLDKSLSLPTLADKTLAVSKTLVHDAADAKFIDSPEV